MTHTIFPVPMGEPAWLIGSIFPSHLGYPYYRDRFGHKRGDFPVAKAAHARRRRLSDE
jgi:hypothetical protein